MRFDALLIRGGAGFIGKGLTSRLDLENIQYQLLPRIQYDAALPRIYTGGKRYVRKSERRLANGKVACAIYLAGLAGRPLNPFSSVKGRMKQINTIETLQFARRAAEGGVARLVYISSIKVNGEETAVGAPFTYDDPPVPNGPYALSKWNAEQGLFEISRETGMEIVIIRPPLVYGPGVKGNLNRLIKLVKAGVPLPLSGELNKRSMVGLDNLVDLILKCVIHPNSGNKVFLVADGEAISTVDMLTYVSDAVGRPLTLWRAPSLVRRAFAYALRKNQLTNRLFCSLEVDITKTCEILDWEPPSNVKEGFRNFLIEKK